MTDTQLEPGTHSWAEHMLVMAFIGMMLLFLDVPMVLFTLNFVSYGDTSTACFVAGVLFVANVLIGRSLWRLWV